MEKHELIGAIEAILFVAGDPVPIDDIAETLELTSSEVIAILDELMFSRASAHRGVLIRKIADKVQFVTNPKYAVPVEALLKPVQMRSFSQSILETLAIIAYKQPVTRSEIESIRGVRCEYAVGQLLSLGIISGIGKKATVGRPTMFGTTDVFLKQFNIASLNQLPSYEEFCSENELKTLTV
jgi:segregation and condensation protein B